MDYSISFLGEKDSLYRCTTSTTKSSYYKEMAKNPKINLSSSLLLVFT